MKKVFALGLVLAAGVANAGVEDKVAACVACHGNGGVSTIPANPTLAGQHKTYIANSLQSYKNGNRSNPIMKGMAAGLSDDDIAEIAEYYSKQPGGLK